MLGTARARKTVGIAAALLALLGATAFAATDPNQTRETYKATVEPICKKNTKANERQLGGVRKLVQKGKLKVAARKVGPAVTSGNLAVKQIKQVAQPPADAPKLKKWIGFLEKEQKLLEELRLALKNEKKPRVQFLTLQLTQNGNRANNSVLGFEFEYCLIPTDQFS